MNAGDRREAIWQAIIGSKSPLKGAEIAAKFAVSRQVIVQDIAVLRASGFDIIATPEGYMVSTPPKSAFSRKAVCRHTAEGKLCEELYAVVDLGGVIQDVTVEHPVYGELRGLLMVDSRAAADRLIARLREEGSAPLSSMTGGVHLHVITADSEEVLDNVFEKLKALNILISE